MSAITQPQRQSRGMSEQPWLPDLRPALVVMRREIQDTLRDWRILAPILFLVLVFPFLANFAAARGVAFVNQYNADILMERLFPFLMLVVGFFPSTFSLVIALETFVGEKERRSLEPLLATPLTDLQLYVGKLLAATAPPVVASYIGMGFYLLLLGLNLGWWPTPHLLLVSLVLATSKALVMVTAAVVVSCQATSVRAANLVASFIIIPMAFLLQAEAGLLLFNNFLALWLVAFALLIVTLILVRLGVHTFNREHLLGRELDQLDLSSGWQTFVTALRPRRGVKHFYRHELPEILKDLRWELVLTVLVVFAGGVLLGWWAVARFPLPLQYLSLDVEQLDLGTFARTAEASGLLQSFSAWGIWWHNARTLAGAAVLGLFTLGILALLMLMAPIVIIVYIVWQVPRVGMDPWAFLGAFVLPHGIIELPAAILATAQAVRIGAVILREPEKGGGVLGILRETGRFVKLFVAVVLPLLLLAAWIEAQVTPRIVLAFLRSL